VLAVLWSISLSLRSTMWRADWVRRRGRFPTRSAAPGPHATNRFFLYSRAVFGLPCGGTTKDSIFACVVLVLVLPEYVDLFDQQQDGGGRGDCDQGAQDAQHAAAGDHRDNCNGPRYGNGFLHNAW
jgi:hypothetical protein